jgi:hypothetical protein
MPTCVFIDPSLCRSPRVHVLPLQIGVMPIFTAYTVFAVVYFGTDVPRFENFQNAFVALFSVLNGDVVRETFMVLMPK